MACLSNNVVIAEILIAKGADLNALNTVSKYVIPCYYKHVYKYVVRVDCFLNLKTNMFFHDAYCSRDCNHQSTSQLNKDTLKFVNCSWAPGPTSNSANRSILIRSINQMNNGMSWWHFNHQSKNLFQPR